MPGPLTVADFIERTAARFARARLHFGHGTDNARDEAAEAVFFSARIEHREAPAAYARTLSAPARARLERLVAARIRTRRPLAYLTKRSWFAGHEFLIDRRVLVPRSPLAELILERAAPFVEAARVSRILDLGTGSGCIAIACAHAFPVARVDATDPDAGARAIARANVRRHRLRSRVAVLAADVYEGLGRRRYDMILSNPPYVPAGAIARFPPEYRREPRRALAAGPDGLAVVRRILAGAAARLRPGGVLVVEVGESARALGRAFPRVPFLWLEFAHGADGVFLLQRHELEAAADSFQA
jgi:ribosomal protein L3 glutamine methyltransferase